MDENMNNDNLENDESSFGSSDYYKRLYDDMPEDVAEMLIGTHPLMKKEISDELTHGIKIKSAKEKNRRAVNESEFEEVTENLDTKEENTQEEVNERIIPSKDPVEPQMEEVPEEIDMNEYVGDITSFTRGLVSSASSKKHPEEKASVQKTAPQKPEAEKEVEEDKSEDDLTAEMIAKMLGGGNVTPVDEDDYDEFEVEEQSDKPVQRHTPKEQRESKEHRTKRKRRQIDEKDLDISNIEKQANLNELFREDDDYYDEKHSGNSVVRIVIVAVVVVVFAFLIYKAASLSGQVTKLNEQITTYKTMETEYEQLKLDNLSLTEQVESLNNQLNGGSTSNTTDTNNEDSTPASTTNNAASNNSSSNNNSSNSNSTSGSTKYTVQSGDTFWGIATKVYGNGSYYTKILSANGLSENDKIKEGMSLTIPAL